MQRATLPPYFIAHAERSAAAKAGLDKLNNITLMKPLTSSISLSHLDIYTQAMDSFRQSELIKAVRERVAAGELLTKEEALLHVFTVDDVSTLPIQLIELLRINMQQSTHLLTLNILYYALQYAEETEFNAREQIAKLLVGHLRARALRKDSLDYQSHFHYLNLRGINLENANLSFGDLSFTDLTGANMSRVNFYHGKLNHSILDRANFTEAFCAKCYDPTFKKGPDIAYSRAIEANFNDMEIVRGDLRCSNFTRSSFADGRIAFCEFFKTLFDDTNLDNTHLEYGTFDEQPDLSMRNTNIINTHITGSTHTHFLAAKEARLLPNAADMETTTRFSAALDRWYAESQYQFANTFRSGYKMEQHYQHFSDKLAQGIIERVQRLNVGATQKAELLETAITHDVMQPQGVISHLVNVAERSVMRGVGLFMTTQRHHEYWPTTAIEKLEQERDRLLVNPAVLR